MGTVSAERTNIGLDIERRRNALGWSQADLAHRAQVSGKTVWNAEHAVVSQRFLDRITRALDHGETTSSNGAAASVDVEGLVTITFSIGTDEGPINVTVTARPDVVPHLDFGALVRNSPSFRRINSGT
jgi:transcriptional regulator with XRE-family HTH domain